MPSIARKVRFSVLLLLMVLLILVAPFLREFIRIKLIMDIVTTAIMIAAIWATGERKHQSAISFGLALPFVLLTWVNYAARNEFVTLMAHLVGILFFGYVIFSILKFVLESKTVTREVIFAAIVSYLLIAVIWAYGYSALELLQPGSFRVPEDAFQGGGSHFIYFSIITLTTLGYGDITPLTHQAGSLTAVEALVGQVYLVVLVAWLVGMYVSRKSR
jgi:hypothetical protein